MSNTTKMDIFKRYQNSNYSENTIYEGKTGASILTEENKSYNILYDRPLFNCPEIAGPDGNVFSLLNQFETCMVNNGYRKEFREFSNQDWSQMRYENVINTMAKFVDMENVVKTVDVDGEIFKKVIKTPENLKNLSEFKTNSIQKFDELIENGFDICSTNAYGRNIMHYIDEPNLLKHIINYNESLKLADKPHLRYISLDNFNSTLLSNRTNFECYNLIFKETIKEVLESFEDPKEMMQTLVFGRDVFNNNSITQMSINFGEVFSTNDNIKKMLGEMMTTLSLIAKVDKSYSDSILGAMYDNKFIDSVAKKLEIKPANSLKEIISNHIVQYNHDCLDNALEKNTTLNKKIKI